MRKILLINSSSIRIYISLLLIIAGVSLPEPADSQISSIKTVFLIVMSNQSWSDVHGNSNAPYINNTLLPIAAVATNYSSPTVNRPILSNYLWLEAGSDFGIPGTATPQNFHIKTTNHLTTLLTNAGISWKTYQEDIDGFRCPLANTGFYNINFNPFIYFDDITNDLSSSSVSCVSHIRPYYELATDLNNNTIARYNVIKPNTCHSMHRCGIGNNFVQLGDSWLAQELPKILASAVYQEGGAIFITWDQGSQPATNPSIGMIILSPFVKMGYSNSVHYTHGSTLRTFQEIFGLTPFLGDAESQTPLDDLFSSVGVGKASATLSWTPSPGATSYSVKRATTNGGPFTTIATGITTPTYIDRGLTNGTTYFYIVTAVNISGESPPSSQVSASPVLIPPAPTNLIIR